MAFIVFEGLDGSGKSSLMKDLETELGHRGIPFHRTREPGGTPLGDEVRNMILRKDGAIPVPRAELLLYQVSRAQHVDEVIRPKLSEGHWVLSDRFSASSVAFQAGGREISENDVKALNHFATAGLKPDLTILLDLSVDEARKRQARRTDQTGEAADRIESEKDSFHERVRQSFLKQSKEEAPFWLVLDASASTAEMLKKVIHVLKEKKWLDS